MIAWVALFFAFLSFLLSLATLALTWQDGRLARNFMETAKQITGSINDAKPSAAPAVAPAAGGNAQAGGIAQADGMAHWAQLDGKFQRMQEMIHNGDGRAKSYVAMIRDELAGMRATSSTQSTTQRAAWLLQAMQTLKTVDDQISKNAPEAARRVQGLANDLRRRLTEPGQLAPATPAGPERAKLAEGLQP